MAKVQVGASGSSVLPPVLFVFFSRNPCLFLLRLEGRLFFLPDFSTIQLSVLRHEIIRGSIDGLAMHETTVTQTPISTVLKACEIPWGIIVS